MKIISNNKNFLLIFILLPFLILPVCKKSNIESNDFIAIFKELNRKNVDNNKYYSSETIKAYKKYNIKNNSSKNSPGGLLGLFNSEVEIKIIKREIFKNKADIYIVYIKNRVENLIGFELKIKFVKEESLWKVDFYKELNHLIQRRLKRDKKNYITDKFKEYN